MHTRQNFASENDAVVFLQILILKSVCEILSSLITKQENSRQLITFGELFGEYYNKTTGGVGIRGPLHRKMINMKFRLQLELVKLVLMNLNLRNKTVGGTE